MEEGNRVEQRKRIILEGRAYAAQLRADAAELEVSVRFSTSRFNRLLHLFEFRCLPLQAIQQDQLRKRWHIEAEERRSPG